VHRGIKGRLNRTPKMVIIGHLGFNLLRKGKVVPVLNEAPCHEDILGDWR